MGVTAIKLLRNQTGERLNIQDLENPSHDGNHAIAQPHSDAGCNMWIPWCIGSDQWAGHHIEVAVLNPSLPIMKKFLWIWQNGDYVRDSTDGSWHSRDAIMDGESGVNGDRILVVTSVNPVQAHLELF